MQVTIKLEWILWARFYSIRKKYLKKKKLLDNY